MFNCRRRCIPFATQQLTESAYISASRILKHWNTVFSSVTHNQEMTESTYLNSERIYAEYRDELDDYVTVTD